MRRSPILLTALGLVLGAPAAAQAEFFAGEVIDSGEGIVVGDADMARDGTGAVVYVKKDGGVDHIFVRRFAGGTYLPPERVDAGLPGPSSAPVVGASNDGRLLVAFVSGGTVHGVVKPSGANPIAPPVALGPGSAPAGDLSINGVGFVTYTSGGDVRVARLDRRTNAWSSLPQPADVDPARAAGDGSGRSRVSVSADGVGVVVWGEAGRVFARKMFNGGLSTSPQDLTPADLTGRAATTSDFPDVDAEDDSSYAWVTFRQQFADGGPARILARRQRGTTFEPPVAVDAGSAAGEPRVDMNGRGVSIVTAQAAGTLQPTAAPTKNDAFFSGRPFGAPGVQGVPPVASVSESNDAVVAQLTGGPAPTARAILYDEAVPKGETVISKPELGAIDPTRGFDVAGDRGLGVIMVWVQGGSLVSAYQDRPPGSFRGYTAQTCCRPEQPTLTWAPAFNIWGAVKYTVSVDGKVIGETADTRIAVPAPLAGGNHKWQVTATDLRGQQRRSKTRLLRIDATSPLLTVSSKRSKRVVSLRVRASDKGTGSRRAAGIRRITVSWGDGSKATSTKASRLTTRHTYPRGSFTLRVTVTDKAGNRRDSRRTIRVGGA